MQWIKSTEIWLFLGAIFALIGCQNSRMNDVLLHQAELLVWQDADSAKRVLDRVEIDQLTTINRDYHRLLQVYTDFRLNQDTLEADIADIARRLEKHRMYARAGEAYYILGVADEWQGEVYSAIEHLKHAESLLLSGNAPQQWLGATYYKMGALSETEQLYDVARDYYQSALACLQQTDMHLFLACTYRDIARHSDDEIERKRMYDLAIQQARMLHRPDFYYELQYLAASSNENADETEPIRLIHVLVDSLHQVRYAHTLISHYIQQGQPDSARYYLDILATDTANMNWSRNRWHYLHAHYLCNEQDWQQAYTEMSELYDRETDEIESTGKSRTYAIARRYDLALEQERNLQLTIRQQHASIIIALLVIGVLLLCLVLLYQRARRRETLSKIERLHTELNAKRETLRRVLLQRIELTQHMQMLHIRHEEQVLPDWVETFLSDSLWEQWDKFQDEFNGLYDNLLVKLKQDYPALTPTDLQIIALIVTGMSIADICMLLNQSKRTIWSRRLRIKTHIGLTADDDLDTWLREAAKQTFA